MDHYSSPHSESGIDLQGVILLMVINRAVHHLNRTGISEENRPEARG